MGRKKTNVLSVDGGLLTKVRVAAGVRGEDIANKLGVNKSAVSRWERQKTRPTDAQIAAMGRMLRDKSFIIRNGRGDK